MSTEHYIPGFLGLELIADGEVLVAPADDDFWNAWNGHRTLLTSIGYGMRKVGGQWQVTFRPGTADKSTILEVLGRIRQRTHEALMKRTMPRW